MTQEAKKEEVGYVVNLAADIGNGQQFSISCNLPKGVGLPEMNTEFDKLRNAFNRQQAKSVVIAMQQELAQLRLRRGDAIEDLARVDAKHESKGGTNSQERSQRETAVMCINKMNKDIAFKEAALEEMKKEAK